MQPPEPPTQPVHGGWPPQPPPTGDPRPPKKKHRVRNALLVGAAALVAGTVIGTVAGSHNKGHPVAVQTSSTPTVTATPSSAMPTPAATPSPGGTNQGSCDYTLGSDPAGTPGTAEAIGEVDLDNTGNIGTVVKVTISWPQEGYAPITASKTVHVPFGTTGQAVRFHMHLTSDELDRLQSWQLGHSGDDGCKYSGTITDTYGSVHS